MFALFCFILFFLFPFLLFSSSFPLLFSLLLLFFDLRRYLETSGGIPIFFSRHQPAALASLLFDPPEPQIIGKTQ